MHGQTIIVRLSLPPCEVWARGYSGHPKKISTLNLSNYALYNIHNYQYIRVSIVYAIIYTDFLIMVVFCCGFIKEKLTGFVC